MPQDFTTEIDNTHPEHWMIDYQYLHRLVRLFPAGFKKNIGYLLQFEKDFGKAMLPKNWP
jgi:hypothetical protein